MDLNMIFLAGFGIFIAYVGYASLNRQDVMTPTPVRTGLLVSQDTGKTHHIQSMTKDASMNIEKLRRKTIKTAGASQPFKMKETHTQLGSKTGAIETFLISS